MNDNKKKVLEEAGINFDVLYKRFMEDDVLIGNYLMKFAGNSNFRKLKEAISENNIEEAFMAAHTLKGICTELYIGSLENIMCKLSYLLKYGDIEPAREIMAEALYKYKVLSKTINTVYGQYNKTYTSSLLHAQ